MKDSNNFFTHIVLKYAFHSELWKKINIEGWAFFLNTYIYHLVLTGVNMVINKAENDEMAKKISKVFDCVTAISEKCLLGRVT